MVIWLIGLSASGKTTIGKALSSELRKSFQNVVHIDGDEVRAILKTENANDYTIEGRRRNSNKIISLCKMLDRQGIIVVCSVLSIFPEDRLSASKEFSNYFEIYIKTTLHDAKQRDTKGTYKVNSTSRNINVVGLDIEFPEPQHAHLTIESLTPPVEINEAVRQIIDVLGNV